MQNKNDCCSTTNKQNGIVDHSDMLIWSIEAWMVLITLFLSEQTGEHLTLSKGSLCAEAQATHNAT